MGKINVNRRYNAVMKGSFDWGDDNVVKNSNLVLLNQHIDNIDWVNIIINLLN
jgi:hypothetical protein